MYWFFFMNGIVVIDEVRIFDGDFCFDIFVVWEVCFSVVGVDNLEIVNFIKSGVLVYFWYIMSMINVSCFLL